MTPRVAVVAVTWFPGETLATFLASVTTAADWSRHGGAPLVVLADNGSTDGSLEAAEGDSWPFELQLLRTGVNLGFGGAANAGIRSVPPGVEWVLLCNPDVVLDPGSVDALLDGATRWPRGGSFGPQLRNEAGVPYPSARELPSLGPGIGHALFGWCWPTNPWTRAYRRDHEIPSERPAGWLSGACLLLRLSAFGQVGGFDERYFMYFEDVDLGDRLGRAGWQNVYLPAAAAMHIGGHATSGQPVAMTAAHHQSAYRYLSGRYGQWWQAPIRFLLWAGLKARAMLAKRSNAIAGGAALPGS